MSNRKAWLRGSFAAVLLALFQISAFADPSGRVGRVSYLSGTVSFFADPDEGWRPARLNYPVTSENSLWTDVSARAEVHIGSAALRLDEDSVLDFQAVTDDSTLAYLQRGSLNVRIRDYDKSDVYRITTPDGQFTLRSQGSYRIDADGERSRITVFQGRAKLDAYGASLTIEGGKTLVLRLAGEAPTMTFEPVATSDFDNWAAARDARLERRSVSRYVPPSMTGYEDLDDYGEWAQAPEYGTVWYPTRVERGWVPYRHGHWSWVRPWGWTWVDDAAWGFAPFHYGRWVHIGGRWGWWPGSYIGRPIYAPALVAWIGNGGWNVSYGVGSGPGIGWFPLAPYEPYLPGYTTNIVYIRNINNFYGNRPVPLHAPATYVNLKPGATVVSPTTLTASAPVASNLARVSGEAVAAQPASQSIALAPARGAAVAGAVGSAPYGAAIPMPKPSASTSSSRQGGGLAEPTVGGQPLSVPVPRYTVAPVGAAGVAPTSITPRPSSVVGQPAPTIQRPGRVSGDTVRAPGSSLGTVTRPAGAASLPHSGSVMPEPQFREARPRPRPIVTEDSIAARARKAPGDSAPQVLQKPHAMEKPIAVEKFQGKPAEGGAKIKEGKAVMGSGG